MQRMEVTRIVTCNEVTVASYFFGNFTSNYVTFFFCGNCCDNVVAFFFGNAGNEFYRYFYRYYTRLDTINS